MKNFWKALGVTALVVGLCPYRVTLDKSTGDKKIRALFWKATYSSRSGGRGLSLDFGFFPPNEEEEAHLYADELVVHYHSDRPQNTGEETPCAQESPCEAGDAPCQAEEAPQEDLPAEDGGEDQVPPPQGP